MSTVRTSGRRQTLARSVRLFRAFRTEQSDPASFYRTLADDSVQQLSGFADLDGATVLDVGGGPGFFADAFRGAGACYYSLDADVGEVHAHGLSQRGTVVGSGTRLPFADAAVDVCYSSNVLEHVPTPWVMADEMTRVTRPGGIVFLSFTVWLGPWGGHETSPWHWLGGERAAVRYQERHGRPPKNRYGRTLFAVSVADALAWARACPSGDLVAAFPRYAPDWARGMVRVPGLRELATWNLALVLRAR
jgi:SAM-dependent methyltransferase